MIPSDFPFDWNIEGVPARLAALWGGGATAEEVARTLSHEFGGALTRNAVSAKIHRLRLVRDVPPIRPKVSPVPLPEPPPVVVGAVDIQADGPVMSWLVPACEAVPSEGYHLADVPLYGCKWPVTGHNVPSHMHRFCGARARTGKPYCSHHHGIAYDATYNAKIKAAGLRVRVS